MRVSSTLVANPSRAPRHAALARGTAGRRAQAAAPALRVAVRTAARAAPDRALRVLELALAALFLVAGVASLADVPAPGADFELLTDLTGAGSWLLLAVGAVEVVGALLLAAPRRAGFGAALLGGLMTATAVAYLALLHAAPSTPGVLLVALAAVTYARRATLAPVGAFLERNL